MQFNSKKLDQFIDETILKKLNDSIEQELNEINTFPGFTSKSMYPQLWQKSGLDFSQLIDCLINLALEKDSLVQVK